jgi:UDP-glucose 4-epimerase
VRDESAVRTKILVTGGAGYIGSHIVLELVQRDYDVVVYDNLSMGHREAVDSDATLIEGDLLDRSKLAEVFAKHRFDAVIHLASHTLVGESMEKPWLYLHDNVVAASHLLQEAVNHGVKRLILSSSSNLFGAPSRIPITESEQIVPGSPYGESKAIIERQLYWMDRLYGLRHCSLRYFNAAGAHPSGRIGEDHDPETHLIPRVLQVALQQRDHITIYGDDYDTDDGTCIRDYVHVMDLATAHISALEALTQNTSCSYNVGSGSGYSVRQVIEVAREVTGHSIPVVVSARRPGDPAKLVADGSAIKADFGWEPQYPELRQIIETAWNWHCAHPHGYRTSSAKDGR